MVLKNKTPEEIKEYNRQKQAERRIRLKSLTDKSLTREENVKLEKVLTPEPKKLWSDFYDCLKPTCQTCQKKGIEREEYNFCSQDLDKKEQEYYCTVYHWTIFQGNSFKK